MQKHNQKGGHPLLTPEIERKTGSKPVSSDRFQAEPPSNQPAQIGRTQLMGDHRHHGRTGGTAEQEKEHDLKAGKDEC